MKTRMNPLYAAGYIAGLRAAAGTARQVSRGKTSVIANAIERRATNDELTIESWRKGGVTV